MEIYIAVLSLVVSSIIALVSLVYTIKQRKLAEKEIKKKRYLEDAQSNLTDAISILRKIDFPDILKISDEIWGDTYYNAYTIANDILRASFEHKTKKVELAISYSVEICESQRFAHDEKDQKREKSTINNFDDLDSRWFIDLFNSSRIYITSDLEIINFEREIGNDIDFWGMRWALSSMKEVRDKLLCYEEVYETLSLDSVKRVNQLLEGLLEEVFDTIHKPKRIQFNLDEFQTTEEIIRYLLKESLNYPRIAKKFSESTQLLSELVGMRKELFRKLL